MLFMISLVVGPVLYFWLPGEIARWHQAALTEQALNGDLTGAIKTLDSIIEQYPDQAGLYLQRAQWNVQLEDYEAALTDCNRAVTRAANHSGGFLLRSQVYQHLGKYGQGVEDMMRVMAISERVGQPSRSMALNGLAYARALAKTDLDDALQEIEEALSIGGADDEGAMLDTRGYVQYLRQDYEAARKDLDEAVKRVEKEYQRLDEDLNGEHPAVVDLRLSRQQLEMAGRSVAVIRYHRYLLYQALDMGAEAQEDLARVRELGHQPGEQLF